MDMKRLINLILITLFFLGSVAAQSQSEAVTDSRLFVDSRNKEITLPSTVERVVSLSPNITEIVSALNSRSILVGRTDYCNYPESVLEVPSVGDLMSPSVEMILSLTPDVVLVSTLGQLQVIEALENAGVKVAYLDESQSMEGTYRLIASVGEILSKEKNAAALAEEMKGEIARVRERVGNKAPVSTYYVAGFGEWGDFTATGDTFIHEIITLAGGQNIASDGKNWSYSIETLLFHDPEVIILPPTWGASFDETKTSFSSHEAYRGLSAVKNGSLYPVDADILNRQGPRSAQAVVLVSQILHPEQ